ncbi:phage protease, partial [uncultured Campylobacter sp.]
MRFQANLISLKSENTGDDLVELLLAVPGEWKGHYSGVFRIDSADLEKMKLNFDARKIDLVIDYEHQTLMGCEAPAAGWIKEMHIRDGKLYGMASWTAKAKEYIKNGEYRYLSPVFNFEAVDKKTGAWIGCEIESVALTNTPFLDELEEIRANKNFMAKEKNMPENEKNGADVAALKAQYDAQITALKAELETSRSEVAALSEQLAESAVEGAIIANKLPEGQKQWALSYAKTDLNGFKEFLKGVTPPQKTDLPKNDLFANKNQPQNDI